jgi:hypothetical protein
VSSAGDAVLAERHNFDPFYGRRLVGDLEGVGLTEIGSEGRAYMWRGNGPGGVTMAGWARPDSLGNGSCARVPAADPSERTDMAKPRRDKTLYKRMRASGVRKRWPAS